MRSLRLYHITSPENAMSIMNSGKFYPVSNHPLNNDNGLNCFSFKQGYRLGQCFENTGAKLIMEWTGEVSATSPNTSPPLSVDILHDQFPWRCFIRGGSNKRHLRIVAIRFEKGKIDDMIRKPLWHKVLPQKLRASLYRRAKLSEIIALRRKYRNGSQLLEIIG